MMRLIRKIYFSSAHVCRNPEWSAEYNRYVYGACSTGSAHGHDYLLEATVSGPVNPDTGIVVNLVDIKQTLKKEVASWDACHLNYDEPFFQNLVPTGERMAGELWRRIASGLTDCRLSRIRLHENRLRYIDYTGDDTMVYVTRRVEFNAAHRLHSLALSDEENRRLFGKCNNPNGHGHNYELEVTVRGAVDEKSGVVMPTGRLDEIIQKEIVDRYDHRNLNRDLPEFETVNPTSEEFARAIWRRLAPHLVDPALYRVRLVETSNNAFEYFGD
jgi:6-pyruvoyltetrahydropterin/6-carboxytetrahydropterin synthase